MIFVTVGAQMPFDRLLQAVDAWAAAHRREDVVAQIGPNAWRPKHIRWYRFLNPLEYRQCVFEAKCVIAHAGIGSIVTALEYAKPMIVMPRRADLKETRNDHQFGTAEWFARMHGVRVAKSSDELRECLNGLPAAISDRPIASHASFELLIAVRQFIRGEEVPEAIESIVQPSISLASHGESSVGRRRAA